MFYFKNILKCTYLTTTNKTYYIQSILLIKSMSIYRMTKNSKVEEINESITKRYTTKPSMYEI
jgi:hypothetical protein